MQAQRPAGRNSRLTMSRPRCGREFALGGQPAVVLEIFHIYLHVVRKRSLFTHLVTIVFWARNKDNLHCTRIHAQLDEIQNFPVSWYSTRGLHISCNFTLYSLRRMCNYNIRQWAHCLSLYSITNIFTWNSQTSILCPPFTACALWGDMIYILCILPVSPHLSHQS